MNKIFNFDYLEETITIVDPEEEELPADLKHDIEEAHKTFIELFESRGLPVPELKSPELGRYSNEFREIQKIENEEEAQKKHYILLGKLKRDMEYEQSSYIKKQLKKIYSAHENTYCTQEEKRCCEK